MLDRGFAKLYQPSISPGLVNSVSNDAHLHCLVNAYVKMNEWKGMPWLVYLALKNKDKFCFALLKGTECQTSGKCADVEFHTWTESKITNIADETLLTIRNRTATRFRTSNRTLFNWLINGWQKENIILLTSSAKLCFTIVVRWRRFLILIKID